MNKTKSSKISSQNMLSEEEDYVDLDMVMTKGKTVLPTVKSIDLSMNKISTHKNKLRRTNTGHEITIFMTDRIFNRSNSAELRKKQ